MSLTLEEQLAVNNVVNNTKTDPIKVEGHQPFMLRHQVMSMDGLEHYADKPYRVRGKEVFNTEKAFSQYIKDFKKEETKVFANLRNQSIEAIFDYDKPDGTPGWKSHSAKLDLVLDNDFKRLKENAGTWMSQQTFVNFLVDYAGFISSLTQNVGAAAQPATKADFLEIVKDLKGMNSVDVEASVGNSSTSGTVSFKSGVKSKGDELPESFTMAMPIYQGEDNATHVFRVEAKTEDTSIKLRYVLVRTDKVVETAFAEICKRVVVNADTPVYGL